MDAKRCDRCGQYYQRDYTPEIQKYELYPLRICMQIDLCDKCMSDLNDFMKPIARPIISLKNKEEEK